MARWQKNHKCEQPQILCFLDTETYYEPPQEINGIGRHRFRLACAHFCRFSDGSESATASLQFSSIKSVWDAILEWSQQRKVLWVFAHNIMFDLWVLHFPELVEKGDIELTRYPVKYLGDSDETGKPQTPWRGLCSIDRDATVIHARYFGRRINFVDSGNYFRSSVESIGESIGVPKLARPSPTASDSDWLTYCRRDVEIIRAAVTGLMREWRINDLGNWQPTLPALAFSSYRHKFADYTITGHEQNDISELEHDAYYDGRTQPFFYGDIRNPNAGGSHFGSPCKESPRPWVDGPAYLVDVQGMYASVMQAGEFPYRVLGSSDYDPTIIPDMPLPLFRDYLRDYACVASVRIDTDRDFYPCRRDGSVNYPIGRFTTTLATPEIQVAIEHNHLVKVNWAIWYHKAPLFRRWVDYWWQRRLHYKERDNRVGMEVCKLLLNSLAGKLAQRERHWENTVQYTARNPWESWCHYDAKTGQTHRLRSIGYTVQELVGDGYSPHALVAAAAHVNSAARVYMLGIRNRLPKSSTLYMGNDSLLLTKSGYESLCSYDLVHDNQLGLFTLKEVTNEASIFGPRDYEISGSVRKAGLPRNARNIGKRKWAVEAFEDSASLLARPPDGSVHVLPQIVRAGEHPPLTGIQDDGWALPPGLREW